MNNVVTDDTSRPEEASNHLVALESFTIHI
jgi:hypothetical protein